VTQNQAKCDWIFVESFQGILWLFIALGFDPNSSIQPTLFQSTPFQPSQLHFSKAQENTKSGSWR
jgi:hypothetical protein